MLNWYFQSGNNSDVITYTKVSISRNIKGIKFPNKLNDKEKENVINLIKEKKDTFGYGLRLLKLEEVDDITIGTLLEKDLITEEFVKGRLNGKAILLNDEQNISIMINEENHLTISVFESGEAIKDLMELVYNIESKIEKELSFAFSEKYGYLTASPMDVGTGLKIKISAHIPGLVHTGNDKELLRMLNKFNIGVDDTYSKKNDIYKIYNNITLGISEREIAENLEEISKKIIENEKRARAYLGKDRLELENNILRSYGILKYARKLKYEEVMTFLSDIKMGVDLGIVDELDDLKINKLLVYTKPYEMQKYFNQEMDNETENIKRAEIVKLIIDNKI